MTALRITTRVVISNEPGATCFHNFLRRSEKSPDVDANRKQSALKSGDFSFRCK